MIERQTPDHLIIPKAEILTSERGKERYNPIPCTSIVIFNGEHILAFKYAKGTTVGEGKWGLPGGHNDINFITGEIEDAKMAVQREIGEEARMILRIDSLVSFEGNEYIANMGKNGTNKWMKMTVLYTHEFFGEPRHVQPEEGKPEWMKIEGRNGFLNLPEEQVAYNTQNAVYDAMRHSANHYSNGIYLPRV